MRKNTAGTLWHFNKTAFVKWSEEEASKIDNFFKLGLWYEFHTTSMSGFFKSRSEAIMHFIVEHRGEELLEEVGKRDVIVMSRRQDGSYTRFTHGYSDLEFNEKFKKVEEERV